MADTSFRVGVRDAVRIAMNFVGDMYEGQHLQDLLLEEVEMAQGGDYWLVTIGFSLNDTDSIIQPIANRKPGRKYKAVKVDAHIGEPISMKILDI